MQQEEYENIYHNEATHFYYRAVHELIVEMISGLSRVKRPVILDAGCGTGLLGKKLQSFGQVQAIDRNERACELTASRGVPVRRGSIEALPFAGGTFDCVVSIDVLYHQAVEDEKALREFRRTLKPEGVLILRVPAFSFLRSPHDRFVHTKKRYAKRELALLVAKAGFQVKKIGYTGFFLFPLAFVLSAFDRILDSKAQRSSVRNLPAAINFILLRMLRAENYLFKHFSFPFGIGLVAVCRKDA